MKRAECWAEIKIRDHVFVCGLKDGHKGNHVSEFMGWARKLGVEVRWRKTKGR